MSQYKYKKFNMYEFSQYIAKKKIDKIVYDDSENESNTADLFLHLDLAFEQITFVYMTHSIMLTSKNGTMSFHSIKEVKAKESEYGIVVSLFCEVPGISRVYKLVISYIK